MELYQRSYMLSAYDGARPYRTGPHPAGDTATIQLPFLAHYDSNRGGSPPCVL